MTHQFPAPYYPPFAPRRRPANWRSKSTPHTLDTLAQLAGALTRAHAGMTVRELGDSLGISRQLALYHVKKGVASGELVMLLQPCPNNGGLQFQVWAPTDIARHFARLLPMSERVDAALAVARAS